MPLSVVVSRNSMSESTYAKIEFEPQGHVCDAESLKAGITRAVSRWISETDVGMQVWSANCQDFNVGDLALQDISENSELGRRLREEDVVIVNLEVDSCDNASWTFDAPLFDDDDINESA